MKEKILDIMREVFENDDLTTECSQQNCDQWDSLHHLTLIGELEDAFDIELEPEEIAQMTTFDKVVEAVEAHQ